MASRNQFFQKIQVNLGRNQSNTEDLTRPIPRLPFRSVAFARVDALLLSHRRLVPPALHSAARLHRRATGRTALSG